MSPLDHWPFIGLLAPNPCGSRSGREPAGRSPRRRGTPRRSWANPRDSTCDASLSAVALTNRSAAAQREPDGPYSTASGSRSTKETEVRSAAASSPCSIRSASTWSARAFAAAIAASTEEAYTITPGRSRTSAIHRPSNSCSISIVRRTESQHTMSAQQVTKNRKRARTLKSVDPQGLGNLGSTG